MKVFILEFYDAHDTWIQGVYESRELAEYHYDRNPEWSEGYLVTLFLNTTLLQSLLWRG